MSATIIYSIDSGEAPFRVRLLGSDRPVEYKADAGIYMFEDVDCGQYTIRITDNKDCVFEIPVDYPCPATTTTTTQIITTTTTVEPTTTTTTEELDEYPCNYLINYYKEEYIKEMYVILGPTTGAVVFDFNTFYIPVKIIVEFDGIDVINTGYRGSSSFQSVLNSALALLGEPTETIGSPAQDEDVFIKSTATTFAKIKIYAPLDGAIASIRLKCPAEIVESFEVAYSDRDCVYEELITTTTTEESVVTTTTTDESTTTTTDCVPDGLLYTRNFYGYYSEYSGAPIIDFRSSEELACIARNGVINEGYSLNNGMAISAQKYYIGWQIYPLNCSMISGYYIYSGFWDTHYESNVLVRIINNVIVERIECPVVTTTTTDEPATTTTTTSSTTSTSSTTLPPCTECVEHGFLYNFYTTSDARKVSSSDDWTVPTKADYYTIATYYGLDFFEGADPKTFLDTDISYWNSPNPTANNATGFTARGSGERLLSGNFDGLGDFMISWASTVDGSNRPELLQVNPDYIFVGYEIGTVPNTYSKGHNIRLVRNTTPLSHGQTGFYVGNDGKVYCTVCIGTQEWLSENLAETKFRNNEDIPLVQDQSSWIAMTSSARCIYGEVGCGELGPTTTTTTT